MRLALAACALAAAGCSAPHQPVAVASNATLESRSYAATGARAILHLKNASHVRLRNLTFDGRRSAFFEVKGIAPSGAAFADFYSHNGILIEGGDDIVIEDCAFSNIAGFAILVRGATNVHIRRVHVADSGSRDARHRNNTTGGILFEEGVTDFSVRDSIFERILGNAVWTHSRYESPRNARGVFANNRFDTIGRDALQAGHATEMTIERNSGRHVGFPIDAVDVENRGYPVAIDTAGNVDRSVYRGNRFEETNGKCIDLDGFHHGEVRGNTCGNTRPPAQFPLGNYSIVMNNTNPDMQSEGIVIEENTLDGPHFGGIFVIGSGNRIAGNTLSNINRAHCNEDAATFGCYHAPGEPDMLRSGIYLGKGAERPAPARGNVIENNRIEGFKMKQRCVGFAPGIKPTDNTVVHNVCTEPSPAR